MILDSMGRPTLHIPHDEQMRLAELASVAMQEVALAFESAMRSSKDGKVRITGVPIRLAVEKAYELGRNKRVE